jgi:two-component system phosphate regulon sensor histidine kinase PhoR
MARRTLFILLLIVSLLGAETILFGIGAAAIGKSAAAGVGMNRLVGIFSAFATAIAGCIGLMGMLTLRRRGAILAASIQRLVDSGIKSRRVECPHADLQPLADGVNMLLERAEQAVATAALQVKELEIRLKVADAERQHAEAIIYSISDAVLVTDSYDDVVLANESAARTFEFDLQRAHRSPVEHLLHDAKLIDLIREMRQSKSKNERRVVDHEVRTAAGGGRTFKCTLSCVADRTDQPSGVVAVLHDMTREREVAQMKNDFVSNVSHELRTPLASIRAYIEMLIDGEAEDERTKSEFYEVIQNEANRLGRLIDDILNISRIESGLIKVNKQPQSVTVIIKEALEVIEPQARQKNIRIQERLTPILYQVIADKDMLYQAVLNLLSNAVKYTPEGGTIETETQYDETRKTMVVRITDTGVGIPTKDLPFVFDKFYRAEANSRMAKGTGLGLSLVKQIIEVVHHGKMFVESAVGKGSCFGFELNLAE